MPNFKIISHLKLIFLISFIAIFIAYYSEYILGHQPCNLCLIERIPYFLSLVVIFLNLKFKKNEKSFILLLLIIFIFSLMISIYHFGIEQGFFQESFMCNVKDTANITTKEELLEDLQKITISCKDVTFKVFGFSLTTINIFISLLLVILLANIFIFYEKFKH
jgi:disulfide bond formation protein DsbB